MSEKLGDFCIALLWCVAVFIPFGFTLSILWNWFIPGIFLTANTINMWQGAGLGTIIGMVLTKHPDDKEIEYSIEKLLTVYLIYALFLGFGFIFHMFVI